MMSCLGCQRGDLRRVESSELDNVTTIRHLDDQNRRQGLFQRYQENVLREESNYVNDTLHGTRVIFDGEGRKEIEEQYQMGVFSGLYRTFYADGNVELEGHYANGEMSGIWIKHYPNGGIMERVTMKENNENGPFVEYHPNGKLKAEGTYRDGDREHGELKLYDEEGLLKRTMMCQDGFCNTTWSRKDQEGKDDVGK